MSELDDYLDSLLDTHEPENFLDEKGSDDETDDLLFNPEPEDELGPPTFDTQDIAGLLGPGGAFEQSIPGFRSRAGQLTLATRIDASMAQATNLLAEGPTGTGKSMAALVPALLHAQQNAQRVLYVTASIMLQEQLAKKDLPVLQQAFEHSFRDEYEFRYAVMKGVSNYVCLLQLEKSEMNFEALNDREFNDAAAWARETETGDLGDYDVELSALNRSRITTTSEECVGRKCKKRDACHLLKARQRAQKANLLVVNYHLFFADLTIRRENDNRGLLPPYSIVILDEAHAAADIARNFFGSQVGPGMVASAASRLNRISPLDATQIRQAADRFFPLVDEYRRSSYYRARLTRALPSDIDWQPLHDALRGGGKAADQASQEARLDDQERKKLVALAGTLERLAANLSATARKLDPGAVYYLEELPGRKGTALCAKPLSVAELMKRDLWQHQSIRTVVAMSATLTASNSFRLIKEDLGADSAETLEVPSPFDWAKQAIACLPPGLPEPNHPSFEHAAGVAFFSAVQAAQGRTLGLFTSRRMMDAVAARTRSMLAETRLPYRVLVQGELPRSELVRQFREDVSSVLIGTSSLWEGVDVSGEALSCVVIDRIPFVNKNDPIADAFRDKLGRAAFNQRELPMAQIDMRQGVGRLIRSVTDRGALVFLDARISLSNYGGKFVPGCLPKGVRVVKSADWMTCIREHLARQ